MTFSLAVHDPDTGHVGVAAMTAMPGVGKLVAHARPQVGAAASQAMMNPYLAFDGLDLLEDGLGAEPAVARLIHADPGRDGRQFGLVDTHGGSASFTGDLPQEWKGHRTGPHLACQGNRLAGPEVLDDAIAAYNDHRGEPMVDRLMAALVAGEAAGGDTKGHRSSTIVVMGPEMYPLWDIRIDDSDDPLAELRDRKGAFQEDLLPEILMLPTRDDPLGDYDYETYDGSV